MAGSIAVASSDIGGGTTKYSVAWTSDASGNVSGNTFDIKRGALIQTVFVPGAAGVQPSNGYTAAVNDANAIDVLFGAGAGLSNANGSYNVPSTPALLEAQTVTLAISNAGNAKSGTIVLYVWL